ncbi:FxLYD domain-containing protein [Natrinema sp. SYSU A 869]|uniref:FxLYD domain-containing protein n=1 Tax=Natrinema sp. SYSU A 869 TaxID=2871694 RepID=UPI001CA3A57F|nr:FxLYD domain-containing protein [Natrinema sp. SYSU A 869]
MTALAGCSGGDDTDRESGGTNNDDSGNGDDNSGGNGDANGGDDLIELLNHEWYSDGSFSSGVRGQVENVSDETLGYVEISVYFIDADGVQFEESLANTSDLAAGRVWEFEAMFLGDDSSRIEEYEVEADVTNI